MKCVPQKTEVTLAIINKGETLKSDRKGVKQDIAIRATENPSFSKQLMEEVLERNNLTRALNKVRKKKGASGVDGMTVDELPGYLKTEWPRIREDILKMRYKPKPVNRVEIPKPNGGVRKLGIPTVVDRFIQQALLEVLQKVYEPTFSDKSYGFRPGKSAHQAVYEAQQIQNEGYRVVIDIDLEKFFDRINHDRLMSKLAKDIRDKRVLKLIREYLKAGILDSGVVRVPTEGAPQGGPLSPLLSNIVLDELDRELEMRGHKFVRYADDCNIYVKSMRAGNRVMENISRFIEEKLKLRINREKSAITRPRNIKFLGFGFTANRETKRRVHKESVKRFKYRVREITRRSYRRTVEDMIEELGKYLRGWKAYYGFCETKTTLKELDCWIRHRIRCFIWNQWPQYHTRVRELVKRGLSVETARPIAKSSKGSWRISRSKPVAWALPVSYFDNLGLPKLYANRT